MATSTLLVLFDGACNLCNGAVHFAIDRDPRGILRFAAIQSVGGRAAIRRNGGAPGERAPDTIVLVEDGRLYERSTAVLRIARQLRAPWGLLYLFIAVPRPLRDAVYTWVARHRYRWFGGAVACRTPTSEVRARFVDDVTSP